jgi:hypothetical protein
MMATEKPYTLQQDEHGSLTVAVSGKFRPDEIQSFLQDALNQGMKKLHIQSPALNASELIFMQAVVLLKREGKEISITWTDKQPSSVLQQVIK